MFLIQQIRVLPSAGSERIVFARTVLNLERCAAAIGCTYRVGSNVCLATTDPHLTSKLLHSGTCRRFGVARNTRTTRAILLKWEDSNRSHKLFNHKHLRK